MLYMKDKTINKKYKKIRSELLNKYDKDKNNIISLDEYLDEEISKGPKENSGGINYHYQNYINTYNFFTLLTLKKIKEFKIMCIPKFEVIYEDKFIDRTTAIFDIYTKKYYFPPSMIEAINECRENNIRLIYFSLVLRISKSYLTHANMVIIDLEKKTLERFEPYGCNNYYDDKLVDDFFKKYVIRYLQLYNFKYLKPINISKKIGIQRKADAYDGMCVTISAMYLQMRILNVNLKQSKIIDYFINMSSKKLKSYILRFAKYIEKTLKSNKNLVNRMNYDLYNNIYNRIKFKKDSMYKHF